MNKILNKILKMDSNKIDINGSFGISESTKYTDIKITDKQSEQVKEFDKKNINEKIKNELDDLKTDFEKEISILKDGKIDIDLDGISNEIEDFKKYIEDLVKISKQIVIKELELIGDEEPGKKEAIFELIKDAQNINGKELSLITMQEIVVSIANLSGVEFKREQNKNDKKMQKYTTTEIDRIDVITKLQIHGTVEYTDFGQEGPVLVIYPEIHYAGDLLKNNFEAHLEIEKYYNFNATEGAIGETDGLAPTLDEQIYIKDLQTKISKFYKNYDFGGTVPDEILKLEDKLDRFKADIRIKQSDVYKDFDNNTMGISSIALERVLGKTIDTIGIEPNNLIFLMTHFRDSITTSSNGLLGKKNYKETLEHIKIIIKDNFIFNNIILKYRNYHWLKNIQNELLHGNNNRGKNFIPITLGAAHAPDLIENAKQKGFGGVIYFEANSMNNEIDIKKTAKAYNKGQGLDK